ncbi:MAG: zf-HC2 domain-containing protein [Planctomycetes bacterium]|nr:zf-HC2 domain-containing protein [Planctomycetota bacterium]
MNCKTCQPLLSRSLDGLLVEAEQSDLENHLEACPACRKEWETQKKIQHLLHSLRDPMTARSVLPAVRLRLGDEEARRLWYDDLERLARRFVPVAAVLFLALSAFALFSTWNRLSRAPEIEWLVAQNGLEAVEPYSDLSEIVPEEPDGVPDSSIPIH